MEKEGLRYRVLVARYGLKGGCVREAGSRGSCWWRDMVGIQDDVGFEGGSWFEENMFRKVGSGVYNCFWTDRWLREVSFCVHYMRLFELAKDRGISVANTRELGWGEDGEGLEVAPSFVGVGGRDGYGVFCRCFLMCICRLTQLIYGSDS